MSAADAVLGAEASAVVAGKLTATTTATVTVDAASASTTRG